MPCLNRANLFALRAGRCALSFIFFNFGLNLLALNLGVLPLSILFDILGSHNLPLHSWL